MKVTAKLNYLRLSPRKVRSLVNVVKGLKAKDALVQLKFIPNKATLPLSKLLKSAIANAEHNFSLAAEDLKISVFKVDGGPIFKRFRPGSRGRVSPVKKRTSHVTLILEGERVATGKVKEKNKTDDIARKVMDESENTITKTTEDKKNRVFKDKKVSQKSPGFVKKIFQRKAI